MALFSHYLKSFDDDDYQFLHTTKEGHVKFEVKASNDVRVALTPAKNIEGKSLMVLIGHNENDGLTSSIDNKHTLQYNRSKQNDWLNINEYREYYIVWDLNTFSCCVEGQPFLTHETHPNHFPIQFVGINTSNGSKGYWKLGGETYETPDDPNKWLFFSIPGKFEFSVRTRGQGRLSLTGRRSRENPIVDVILGASNNSEAVIRLNRRRPPMVLRVRITDKNIMSKDEFRPFTLSWNNGQIKVIKGFDKDDDEEAFLKWNIPEVFGVGYVGMTTFLDPGLWTIDKINNDKYSKTHPYYPFERVYTFFPRLRNKIEIEVIATNEEVQIALVTEPNEFEPMYEVHLSNNKSRLLRGPEPFLVSSDTPNLLNPTQFVILEISWNNGSITIGLKGREPILTYIDHRPFGIGSYGLAGKATWLLPDINGRVETESLEVTSRYMFYPIATGQLDFDIQASSNVFVVLGTSPSLNTPYFEIAIGGWDNNVSSLRYQEEDNYKARHVTQSVLNENEVNKIYISWSNHYISVQTKTRRVLQAGNLDLFGVSYYGIWTPEGIDSFKEHDPEQ